MVTDPISIGLTIVAGVLAAALAWVQRPVAPALDAERWFKIALCTLVRGDVERAGGTVDQFEARVRDTVPYHPAGRQPERKVSNPAAAAPSGAALPGELALLEALGRIDDPKARIARLYAEDEGGLHARLDDPAELGPDHDFAALLAPEASWDALAAWPVDPRFGAALWRKLDATMVTFEGRAPLLAPSVFPALRRIAPDTRVIPWTERTPAETAGMLRTALGNPSGRMVVFAEGTAVLALLRGLAEAPDVRDRVAAVVSVGGVIGGLTTEDGPYGVTEATDWLGAHFDQRSLETDLVRLVPYLSLQWWDPTAWPPGVPGLPLQHQRFPDPRADDGPEIVEVMDLGPLFPAAAPDLDLVARALAAVVGAIVVSRRG